MGALSEMEFVTIQTLMEEVCATNPFK